MQSFTSRIYNRHNHHHRHPQSTQTHPFSNKMQNFPQELLDLVIDELAELEELEEEQEVGFLATRRMSSYSTISRKWVKRTQFQVFKELYIPGQQCLHKWLTTITPDPHGISSHVKRVTWHKVDTLEGFDEHIRAFTRLDTAIFRDCEVFCSLNNVPPLASFGSSLVHLVLDELTVSSEVMAQFLSFLPSLRRIDAHDIITAPDSIVEVSHPNIPFFETGRDFSLRNLEIKNSLNLPGWTPPTAWFSKLEISYNYFCGNPGVVNGWIASSGSSLKNLSLCSGFDDTFGGACLDVSNPVIIFPSLILTISSSRSHFRHCESLGVYIS
jgi:hypothetical protein